MDAAAFVSEKNGKHQGMICVHVDDLQCAGSTDFQRFVFQKLGEKFTIGSSKQGSYTYCGCEITTADDGTITVSQTKYLNSLKEMSIMSNGGDTKLSRSEYAEYRTLLGNLGWVVNSTMPSLSFSVLELTFVQLDPRVSHAHKLNKCLRIAKKLQLKLVFPPIDFKTASLACFTDASFGNHPDGSSVGGFFVFAVESKKMSLLSWSSRKLKRVASSTVTAETLALISGIDMALFLKHHIENTYRVDFKVNCFVDSKNLVDLCHNSKTPEERRLKIDLNAIRQMYKNGCISQIRHLASHLLLADILTKEYSRLSKKSRETVENVLRYSEFSFSTNSVNMIVSLDSSFETSSTSSSSSSSSSSDSDTTILTDTSERAIPVEIPSEEEEIITNDSPIVIDSFDPHEDSGDNCLVLRSNSSHVPRVVIKVPVGNPTGSENRSEAQEEYYGPTGNPVGSDSTLKVNTISLEPAKATVTDIDGTPSRVNDEPENKYSNHPVYIECIENGLSRTIAKRKAYSSDRITGFNASKRAKLELEENGIN